MDLTIDNRIIGEQKMKQQQNNNGTMNLTIHNRIKR